VDKGKPLVFLSSLVRNMQSSGSSHSDRQMALWKTDWVEVVCLKFRRSQISYELFPPIHTESSVTSSSRFAPARDSLVNLLYRFVDHLLRGFHFADDRFRAKEDSSDWRFSVYGFPALGARSRSGSNSEDMIS
jgi:hypothetical protein